MERLDLPELLRVAKTKGASLLLLPNRPDLANPLFFKEFLLTVHLKKRN
jgi:hypothetical protein